MPVNHIKKFIFVHIPKTAGTTTYRILGIEPTQYNLVGGGACNEFFLKSSVILQHLTAPAIQQIMPDVWEHYYKFAFMRNPYHKLVSAFHYNRGFQHFGVIGWEGFMNKLPEVFATWQHHHLVCHLLPQYMFVCINGNIALDFVGKYDNVEQHLGFLHQKFYPDEKFPEIPVINKGNYGSAQIMKDYFSRADYRKTVEKMYARDFEIYESLNE